MLALSYEDPGQVADYVERLGIGLRVAAGTSKTNELYAVRGYPTSVLVDPNGEIVWRGHPMQLTHSAVEKALEDAEEPAENEFLAFRLGRELGRALQPAQAAAARGELGKALQLAVAVRADDAASKNDREDAANLITALEGHVALLDGQATERIEARDALRAVQVLDGLADALRDEPAGKAARERLKGLEKDEDFARELAAAEALADARAVLQRNGPKRAKSRLERIVKSWPGTRAAEEAERYLKDT